VVIVDTTVWVDYLDGAQNPETEWLDREVGKQEIALTDLILCETLQGVRSDREFARVKALLGEFELFVMGGEELCTMAAQNYRALRERGRTVRKTIDCLIATFCLMRGYSLLHRDRDYDHFEQELHLKVIRP
jgi:predicted nucleic acid-binding protein